MSWQALAWVYQQSITSTPSQTLVLQYLCSRHNFDLDEAFCSLTTIARDCNLDKSRVCKILKELEAVELITRLKSERAQERGCNSFEIHWSDVHVTNPKSRRAANTDDDAGPGDTATPGGDNTSPGGCPIVTGGGDALSPRSESYIESKGITKKSTRPATRTAGVYSADFETWWKAWSRNTGRKRGKLKAARAWKQLGSARPTLESLLADLEARAAGDDQWAKGYIPWAERYLEDARWEDPLSDGKPNLRPATKTQPAIVEPEPPTPFEEIPAERYRRSLDFDGAPSKTPNPLTRKLKGEENDRSGGLVMMSETAEGIIRKLQKSAA